MKGKVKAACPVCQLAPEIRAQLGTSATKKGFSRPDQLEWLRTVVGASKLTLEELNTHLNGKHDQGEAFYGTA